MFYAPGNKTIIVAFTHHSSALMCQFSGVFTSFSSVEGIFSFKFSKQLF